MSSKESGDRPRVRVGNHSENQLVGYAAKRVDVGSMIDVASSRLFWRHVHRRPDRDAGLCLFGSSVDVGSKFCEPEVEQLDGRSWLMSHSFKKDILGLEIAMDDSRCVCSFECLRDLVNDVERFVKRCSSAISCVHGVARKVRREFAERICSQGFGQRGLDRGAVASIRD
jgi:hypothetical protein